MPRTCLACRHSDRAKIDRALVAGEPLRSIAKHASISDTALFRHRAHIETALAQAKTTADAEDTYGLARKLTELSARARRLADAAEEGGDLRTALAGVRELSRILEIEARVAGQIREGPQINIGVAAFKLEGRSEDVITSLIQEKLDGPGLKHVC
jgi:hypothetical protein